MYRQEEPEVNWNQMSDSVRGVLGRFRLGGGGGLISTIVVGLFAVVLIGWAVSGFFTVQPGEEAALRLFGKFTDTQGPGLHWFWPSPIGKVSTVDIQEVRKLEIGLRGTTPVLPESLMITGDENIVDAQLVVQYDIQRSITDEDGRIIGAVEQFLFHAAEPDGAILKSATESALRQVVGQRDIDDVLGAEKEAVQAEVKELLQGLMDDYQTGVRVREVKLQSVLAPAQVKDAFDDVVRANEDRERIIRLAEAYEADILPKAKGQASRTLEIAEAFRAERIAKATGEASRFLQVLEEFKLAPEVTRQRLYLEAIEEILAGVQKYIIAADSGGNLLQFLPLSEGSTTIPGTGQ